MSTNFQKTIQTLIAILNVALLVMVFFLVWSNFYNNTLPIPFFRRGNYILYMLYAVILYAFILLMKGHRIGSLRILEIVLSQAIALILTNIVTYFQVSLLSYKLAPVGGFLLMTAAQIVLAAIWAVLSNRVYNRIFAPQKMVFLYDDPSKVTLANKLNVIKERFSICYYVDAVSEKSRIAQIVEQYPAVLVAVNDPAMQEWLIRLCYEKQKRLYFMPSITDVIKNGAQGVHAVDTPLLLCRNGRLTTEERIIKRAFDLLVSAIGIIVLSPLMLVTAAAIWLYDRKGVIYTQPRLTRDARVFNLYKFRSMVVDAEKDGVRLTVTNDERVTPVGRFIRKCRLDELPQLFNILLGDMSFVGPRPERPEIAAEYEREFPAFRYRLNVKAGLTGNAQVYGNYDTSSQDKLLMDLMYIENYSFLQDLSLMFQTLRIILIPSRAEGFQEDPVLLMHSAEGFIKKAEPSAEADRSHSIHLSD
ncbi:MAG TPA: exopolysaccharide biosynthesis polyprenyl glycosylphosphotransferase [Feifaniaceae bacterium]|nr:exopolysaccharide biosynthesis polyprenyl glycosylphosphotransferase [Feifaniaceae bacterium]